MFRSRRDIGDSKDLIEGNSKCKCFFDDLKFVYEFICHVLVQFRTSNSKYSCITALERRL